MDEHRGPITTWAEFEAYPWPDPATATTRSLEFYQRHLPDDMCIIAGGGFGHFAEHLNWLMGYETMCYALYDQRDLVRALADKLLVMQEAILRTILQFDRVKVVWGSDDMGFRTGTLISPNDLREFVLPGHKRMAEMAHERGLPYLLHTCGKMEAIMPDLIDDVKIDARHSFEDVIEPVIEAKSGTATASRCSAASTWTSSAGPTKRPSAAACARRWTRAIRAAATASARATASPTTSRWTTTWRCRTRAGAIKQRIEPRRREGR
jgi:hypothetical protein